MQEPKSIYDFISGDIVTRIEPAALINRDTFFGAGINYDSSYIGEKLIFIGIANGCAYFEPTDSFSKLLQKKEPISLRLNVFEHGWAHYIDPSTLIRAKSFSKYKSLSNETLVDMLDEASLREDYEEASRIKHEIDSRGI